MAAKITVEKMNSSEFRVRISEGGSESSHHVTLSPTDYTRLTGAGLKHPFEKLSVISCYFPEFDREIKRRLS